MKVIAYHLSGEAALKLALQLKTMQEVMQLSMDKANFALGTYEEHYKEFTELQKEVSKLLHVKV